jgi:hypothetical protein
MLPQRDSTYSQVSSTVSREYLCFFGVSTVFLMQKLLQNDPSSRAALLFNIATEVVTFCGVVGASDQSDRFETPAERASFENSNTLAQHMKVAFDLFSKGAEKIGNALAEIPRMVLR